MKRLVLALALANFAFLGWQILGRPKPDGEAVPAAQGSAPRLVLLSELPDAQRPTARAPLVADELPAGLEAAPIQPTASEKTVPGGVAPPPVTCFHLGGFSSAAGANATKVAIENLGAAVGTAAAERFARTRYWVLLPPSRSEGQALALVERLRQAGVKDYYLIPEGPNRHAISLGVFSAREGATRRVSEVARLKLKVRVEKVDYPGRRFALDVRWSGPAPDDWQTKVPPGIEITNPVCNTSP